jgi:hypothetical protein
MNLYTYPQNNITYPQFNKQFIIFKIHIFISVQPSLLIHLSTPPTTSTTN